MDQHLLYGDSRDRTWHVRALPLLEGDPELVCVIRRLSDEYVVLTWAVSTALSYSAVLQLKFVANWFYYGCEELPGEGVEKIAKPGPQPGSRYWP
jgi:hypothetical protein